MHFTDLELAFVLFLNIEIYVKGKRAMKLKIILIL